LRASASTRIFKRAKEDGRAIEPNERYNINMGGLFSKGGKGGKGDFDIVIGQPDYNSFQKVTDAAMVKDYLQSNQPQSQHGPSENAGPAAASKAESLPPPPAPREGQGEKAASKKTSSTGDDEEDSDLTEDHSEEQEEASNVEPAAVRQGGDDVSAPSEETEDS
jgi:hypothetical protein